MQAPICVPAWAYCKVETSAASCAAPWMGFLLVSSAYLRDPPIVGASPRALLFALCCCIHLYSQLQPGLPNQLLFLSCRTEDKPRQGHLQQLLCSSRAARLRHAAVLLLPSARRGCIERFCLQGHQSGSFPQH